MLYFDSEQQAIDHAIEVSEQFGLDPADCEQVGREAWAQQCACLEDSTN